MVTVGSVVWVCQWFGPPSLAAQEAIDQGLAGPFPAIVVRLGAGQELEVVAFTPNPEQDTRLVTPWALEDGATWGWLEVPADGIIPPDLFS